MLEMMPTRNLKPDENQAMKAVVQFCSANFTKELSLSILEDELHLSKYYISHLFGDKLGIRFNDYINSLRISEACRLLRTTSLSITEISEVSGFGTLRTFNRAFIKQLGTSPSEYRKNNRGDILDVSVPVFGFQNGGSFDIKKNEMD
jgi:AraC-like DNA-binding protein